MDDPNDSMLVVIQVDSQIRIRVPKGNRSRALGLAESKLHTEFSEFSRRLEDQGFDALFHVNERPVRRAPERRFSPIDIEMPVNEDGIEYERRWDKRMQLQDERHVILELLSKAPEEGSVEPSQLRLRLSQIESLLREPPK